MTRRAAELSWSSPKTPALPISLELDGQKFHLSLEEKRDTPRIIYRGPDLHWIGDRLPGLRRQENASPTWKKNKAHQLFATAPVVTRELVQVTGSHHYLAFWIEGGDDQELRQLPFVFLLDEQRWLPRKDAFLQPPDALPHIARWNANCIQCHTVAGKPGQSEGRDATTGTLWEKYETTIAEEGISCEACHGPGKAHIDHYRNPWSRASARSSNEATHIFVPEPATGERGSEACGQCHSYFTPLSANEWWQHGFSRSYQAGESLAPSRKILRANSADQKKLSRELSTIFWNDGSMIVGGREYNGLSESPCFKRGHGERKLACTSCHSMHNGDPNQQLDPTLLGDALCTQCHAGTSPEHSRHVLESPGARCVNCHMPRTSYALLHGIASHQIASPRSDLVTPPNACILCHVDRGQGWLQRELAEFHGKPNEQPAVKPHELPLAVERALSGNAAERAIYAYALGQPESHLTAGTQVATLLLPILKKDPYAAVRLIAARSEANIKDKPHRNITAKNPDFTHVPENTLQHLIESRDTTPIVISE